MIPQQNAVDMATLHRIAKAILDKDKDRARHEILKILKQEPADPGSLMNMSLFLEAMGDYEEALKSILLAIVLDADSENAGSLYKLVARLLDRQGRKTDAKQVLQNGWEKCKTLYPSNRRESERKKFFDIYNRLPVEEK